MLGLHLVCYRFQTHPETPWKKYIHFWLVELIRRLSGKCLKVSVTKLGTVPFHLQTCLAIF